MFSSRSIIFVVFSAVLLFSGTYGQDDPDCTDPNTYLSNILTSLTNIQNIGTTLQTQFPLIGQTAMDKVLAMMDSDDVQGPLSDTVASMSDVMDNVDDIQSVATQTMGQMQAVMQDVLTNPMVLQIFNDFIGNMNDLYTNGIGLLKAITGKAGDLSGPLGDSAAGVMSFLSGPDMQNNVKALVDNSIGYADTMINQAVSDGVNKLFGVFNTGLDGFAGGLTSLPDISSILGSNGPGTGSILDGLGLLDSSSLSGLGANVAQGLGLGANVGLGLGAGK